MFIASMNGAIDFKMETRKPDLMHFLLYNIKILQEYKKWGKNGSNVHIIFDGMNIYISK